MPQENGTQTVSVMPKYISLSILVTANFRRVKVRYLFSHRQLTQFELNTNILLLEVKVLPEAILYDKLKLRLC